MATVMGDVSSEARYEYRGLRGFVNLGDEVGMCSHDRGSMELAMEVVTAERACLQAKHRNRYLQGLVCEASEALDRVPQCSWCSNVEVDEQEVCKVCGREVRAASDSWPPSGREWRLRDSGNAAKLIAAPCSLHQLYAP